jgi:hypothetical protein
MTTPTEPPDQFDEEGLCRIIKRHWSHHAPCNSISVETSYRPDRADWNILIAPAFQEVVGGSQDGILIWAGFDFDITNFLEEPEIEVDAMGTASYCIQCSPLPFVGFKGRFKGKPFFLRISLEPIPDSKALEFVDAIRNQVRPVEIERKQ